MRASSAPRSRPAADSARSNESSRGTPSARRASPARRPLTPRHLREAAQQPGPGQYEVRTSPEGNGLAGSAAFRSKGDRSLVSKARRETPGAGNYNAAAAADVAAPSAAKIGPRRRPS